MSDGRHIKKPMTITEKILAKAFGKEEVEPAEIGDVKFDLLCVQDVPAPGILATFDELEQLGGKVYDPSRIVLCYTRKVPPTDSKSAEFHKQFKLFSQKHGIPLIEMGQGGIEHQVLPEQGYIVPGMTIVGSDSHTCTHGAFGCFSSGIGGTESAEVLLTGKLWIRVPKSIKINVVGHLGDMIVGKDVFLYVAGQLGDDGALYKAVEWAGPVVEEMSIASRMTLSNMSVEIGAKNGIIEPNEETLMWVRSRSKKQFEVVTSDYDADYDVVLQFDISCIEPQVAVPFSPANARSVSEVAGTKLDQVFIGSCTNGRLEDLRMAATILRGQKVHPDTRLIVVPASQEIYAEASKEALLTIFVDSGAIVGTPNCGACGGQFGFLGDGEVCLATSNRNFRGRMGSPTSKVYLANAAVAAASAIAGEIVDPRKFT